VFQWLKKEGGLVRPLAHEHPVHRGMMQLKGHRAVGGMRASIYNAGRSRA
jgi:phosphoserine aminotransferase